MLQLAMAVEVLSKSPLLTVDARQMAVEGGEEEEEEGLTAEDLADLDKIDAESSQFLKVRAKLALPDDMFPTRVVRCQFSLHAVWRC